MATVPQPPVPQLHIQITEFISIFAAVTMSTEIFEITGTKEHS